MITNDGVVGFLYADIDGTDGRFDTDDRDLLAALAAQAAAAWLHLRAAEASARESAQRRAEIAVVNSIAQGISRSLGFQAIVDIVGDKLCEIFGSDNLAITWRDPQAPTETAHMLYAVQHGHRVTMAPLSCQSAGTLPASVAGQPAGAGQQPRRDGCLGPEPAAGPQAQPGDADGADLRRRCAARRHHRRQPRSRALLRRCRRAPAADRGHKRRPGARKRAPVRRDQAGAGAAEGHCRHPARTQQFGGRHAAGVRQDSGELQAPVRRRRTRRAAGRRARPAAGGRLRRQGARRDRSHVSCTGGGLGARGVPSPNGVWCTTPTC